MSNQDKVNKGRGNFLENCTITELEELLNAAAQDVPIDEAYVAELEAAILRCETERPTGRLSEPDEAWERFRRTRLAGDTSRLGLSNKGKVCKTSAAQAAPLRPGVADCGGDRRDDDTAVAAGAGLSEYFPYGCTVDG